MSSRQQVLVVGAGPTGLTLALELARRGVVCRIIDRLPSPLSQSRAYIVHTRTLEHFQSMGIADEMVDAGITHTKVAIFYDRRWLVKCEFDKGDLDIRFPFLLCLPQAATERILGARLTELGIAVERSIELTHLEQQKDGVSVTLRHLDGRDEQFETNWVIGCDGAHSRTRQLVNAEFTGGPLEEVCLIADVRIDWSPEWDQEKQERLFKGKDGTDLAPES